MLQVMLEQACDAYFLRSLQWIDIRNDGAVLCPLMGGACQCPCWQKMATSLGHVTGTFHAVCAEVLQHLVAGRACPAIAAMAWQRVCLVADHIDARTHVWGDSALEHATELVLTGPSGHKRRRLDEHVLSKALTSPVVGASAPLVATASTDRRHLREHVSQTMGTVMAASHLTFSGSMGTIASVWDAVRLGNPTLDLLVHVAWHCKLEVSTVLPPGAPL